MSVDRAIGQAQVARILHKDPKTIRRWTRAGLLPVWFYDDNGRAVYSEATIAAHQRRSGEIQAEQTTRGTAA